MTDFEPKDIIGDAVTRGLILVRERSRGDVVAWEDFEQAAGFDRFSPHFTQFLKRVRRDFLDSNGVKLFPVNGVGLKLMTITEQVTDMSRQRRAYRQTKRALRELKAIPDNQLTAHQKMMKYQKIERARMDGRTNLHSIRIGFKLARPSRSGMPKPAVSAK